jgi:hypothetical protein
MAFLSAGIALLVISGCWCLVISYTIADTLEKGEWEVRDLFEYPNGHL